VKVSAENEGAATCFNGCVGRSELEYMFNPLNAELNPICHLLALLGAHHNFHVSGLRVKAVEFHFRVFSFICYVHLYFLDFTFSSVSHTLYIEGSVAVCLIYNISLCSRNFFVQREFQTCPT
jgi:hypothetical protein